MLTSSLARGASYDCHLPLFAVVPLYPKGLRGRETADHMNIVYTVAGFRYGCDLLTSNVPESSR